MSGQIRKLGSNMLPTQKVGFNGLNIQKLSSNSRIDLKEPVRALPEELPSEVQQEADRIEAQGASELNQGQQVGGIG
jgi:hypothetical protein